MLAPPPPSADSAETARREHTRLRRRILYGHHDSDVVDRLVLAVGSIRRSAWGPIDMTANPYLHVWTQLAALYRQAPEVDPPVGGEDTAAALADSGHWQLMQRVQRDCLGLREMLVRVDLLEDGLHTRPVFPDLVEATTTRSGALATVREWIQDPADSTKWIAIDTDPVKRIHRATDQNGLDVSADILGGDSSGEAYPWMSGDVPLMPYVVYHAAETGWLWDAWTGREVVEGTLQLSVFYSFFAHILRSSAWAQRYIIGGEPGGAGLSQDGSQRTEVITDPSTVLVLQAAGDGVGGQVVAGQWASPADPATVLASIRSYEQRLVEMAVGAADVTRASSDIRSGYSLAVSREAVREAQRSYEPMFRRGDLAVLRIAAALLGAPTDGWRIRYSSIPRDPAELAAEWDRMAKLIEAGLLDRATAYQELHPGLTREEAEAAVAAIARSTRLLGA